MGGQRSRVKRGGSERSVQRFDDKEREHREQMPR